MDAVIFTTSSEFGFARSYGAYLLASVLRQAGYSCQVIDFFDMLTIDDVKKISSKYINKHTKFIGFSSTFFFRENKGKRYPHGKDFMQQFFHIFEKYSNLKFLYGGANVDNISFSDANIDVWFKGDAERQIIQFMKSPLVFERIYGNIVDCYETQNDNFSKTAMKWEANDFLISNEHLPLEISRGCPWNCLFCHRKKIRNEPHEKNIETLQYEIQRNYELFGITTYFISDDVFCYTQKRMDELYKLFTSQSFKIKFSFQGRLDQFTKHPHWREMVLDMGCFAVHFGIESLSLKVQKIVGKIASLDTLYYLHEKWNKKIFVSGSLIAGLPYENESDIQKNMEFLQNSPVLDVFSYLPLYIPKKGFSRLGKHPAKYGYTLTDSGWISHTSDMTSNKAVDICKKHYHHNPVLPFFHYISRLHNIGYNDILWNDKYRITEENRTIWEIEKENLKNKYIKECLE